MNQQPPSQSSGSIVCVGLGMTLGAHLSPLSRNHIAQADVVFVAVSNPVVEAWVMEMNPDVRSLQSCYQDGKDRRQSYRDMVDMMMQEVRAGKNVVGAFYGHPGVFALPPHDVIRKAREEGYYAHMEPGISAEDCLYADMGIDPGSVGSIHYEASQFMFYNRAIDTAAYVILWQVGIAGDKTYGMYSSPNAFRQVLCDQLLAYYPADHQIALYECPTLPIHGPRITWLPLSQLADAQTSQETTMVIPPARVAEKNHAVLEKLKSLHDQQQTVD
ncbi:hypothetical protein LJ739_06075 [Aestuariibacter halophilus]|uniref:Tetrapyrrole methylase domain-containing protein n=1 Tax=Fluctibacter halophilus TaxID=226011 RepID=A0ABS8G5G7_9ALTE|nr:SAM-dependent methyltransferase [Aestuariibacter halophilus]MCC2615800.1 hypothetical protein [Aestuariibacter halophilus]